MAARIGAIRPPSKKGGSAMISAAILSTGMFLAGLLLSGLLKEPENEKAAPAPRKLIEIPVARDPVPAGTAASEIKFVSISLPEEEIPNGALRSLSQVIDKRAALSLPSGVPLLRSQFAVNSGPENPVADSIPPGMRAMTVKVDATSAVEGWAGSGSIVDVLLVEKDRTSVIAEKVKVLSAERSVSPVDGRTSPNVPSTVTLLTSQEQCLAINTAIPLGRIAFALRSAKDEDRWLNPSFSSERFRGGAAQTRAPEPVSGYAAVKDESKPRVFALSSGRWVRTEVFPEGFGEAGVR